jgi:hypothetical protein
VPVVRVATFLCIALACATPVLAENFAMPSGGSSLSARGLVLGCHDKVVSIAFEWAIPVGNPGSYARHLFLPGPLGEKHVMLKVLAGGTRTGSTSDPEAKELIQLLGSKVTGAVIFASVFPAGRDKETGKWEDTQYDVAQFNVLTKKVAKQCHWNINRTAKGALKMVEPGKDLDE